MRQKIGVVRICMYFILLLLLQNVSLDYIEGRSFCIIYNLYEIKCFGCGTTRAFFNLLHLNYSKAINYNVMAVILVHIAAIVIIQDIVQVIKVIISKDKSKISFSLVEEILINLIKIRDKIYV